LEELGRKVESHLGKYPLPKIIIIAFGTNNLVNTKEHLIVNTLSDVIDDIHTSVPQCRIMFSDMIPSRHYKGAKNQRHIDQKLKTINRNIKSYVGYPNGISHPQFKMTTHKLILGYPDWVHVTNEG
jgi:hypothetical protein